MLESQGETLRSPGQVGLEINWAYLGDPTISSSEVSCSKLIREAPLLAQRCSMFCCFGANWKYWRLWKTSPQTEILKLPGESALRLSNPSVAADRQPNVPVGADLFTASKAISTSSVYAIASIASSRDQANMETNHKIQTASNVCGLQSKPLGLARPTKPNAEMLFSVEWEMEQSIRSQARSHNRRKAHWTFMDHSEQKIIPCSRSSSPANICLADLAAVSVHNGAQRIQLNVRENIDSHALRHLDQAVSKAQVSVAVAKVVASELKNANIEVNVTTNQERLLYKVNGSDGFGVLMGSGGKYVPRIRSASSLMYVDNYSHANKGLTLISGGLGGMASFLHCCRQYCFFRDPNAGKRINKNYLRMSDHWVFACRNVLSKLHVLMHSGDKS